MNSYLHQKKKCKAINPIQAINLFLTPKNNGQWSLVFGEEEVSLRVVGAKKLETYQLRVCRPKIEFSSKRGTDYYPFGWKMPNRQQTSAENYRFGFQGQFSEEDDETGWNSFELRSCDTRIGRWMNPDPAGQFFSPYISMGNEPINGVDPNGGFRVKPTDVQSYYAIINTLDPEDAKYVKLDKDGFISKDILNLRKSNSINFNKLKNLVNDNDTYQVSAATSFQYIGEDGLQHIAEFGPINQKPLPSPQPGPFGPSTGEWGWFGVTMTDQPDSYYKPTGDFIHVVLNSDMSDFGMAELLAHELFGHAYLYYLDLPNGHIVKNWVETNLPLREAMIESINEATRNQLKKF